MHSTLTRRDFLRFSAGAGVAFAANLRDTKVQAAGLSAGHSPGSRIVVGLDIGSSKVCAAVGERLADGSIQILGIGEAPSHASKWGLHDPEGTRRSVREALVNAEVNTDVMIGAVVVGLNAGPKGRLRNPRAILDFLEQHEVNEPFNDALCETGMWDDIRQMANFADNETEALLLDLPGDRLLAHAPYTGFWNDDLLVEVEQSVISPVATAEALLSREDKDRGALVIDMGAGTTDFTVCVGGLMQSDCIQVGSRYLAIDVPPSLVSRLRGRLKSRFGDAEQCGTGILSRDCERPVGVPPADPTAGKMPTGPTAGTAVPLFRRPLSRLEKLSLEASPVLSGKLFATGRVDRTVAKTGDRRTEDFKSLRVMHTFELVKARLELKGINLTSLRAGVHLTGGYSALPEVRDFAEWILGIPAQIGRVKGISAPARHLENPRFACSMGLAKLAARTGA